MHNRVMEGLQCSPTITKSWKSARNGYFAIWLCATILTIRTPAIYRGSAKSWRPIIRAQYDLQQHAGSRWKLGEEASDTKGIERDIVIQDRLLSLLYAKRRQNIADPGIGDYDLEHLRLSA